MTPIGKPALALTHPHARPSPLPPFINIHYYFPRTKQVRSWWDSLDAQPTPLAYEVWVYILYDQGDHYFDSPAREAEVHAALTLTLTLTL